MLLKLPTHSAVAEKAKHKLYSDSKGPLRAGELVTPAECFILVYGLLRRR